MTKDTEFDLWHYTDAEGLKGILSNQTLWATDYRYLNDSSEFIYSKSVLLSKVLGINFRKTVFHEVENNGKIENSGKKGPQEIIEDLFGKILNFPIIPYVLSFCKMPIIYDSKLLNQFHSASGNNGFLKENGLLSQWRGYGKDGGYAVIFDSKKLIERFEAEGRTPQEVYTSGDVSYRTDKLSGDMETHFNTVKEFVCETHKCHSSDQAPPGEDAIPYDSLFHCMLFLKHKGFEEEIEYRFCIAMLSNELRQNRIKIRNKGGTIVPYIELFEKPKTLPIKGICIGPHHDKELRAKSIKAYLDNAGLVNIEVFCSGIPYIGSR
jgi:hypothetical protein